MVLVSNVPDARTLPNAIYRTDEKPISHASHPKDIQTLQVMGEKLPFYMAFLMRKKFDYILYLHTVVKSK